MEKIKCIVIDDEEGAHKLITHFLRDIHSLQLDASFYNATDALDYLYSNQVDLIFLDINMPGLSGIEMLDVMSKRPFIIFTTAYQQFALDGYRYEAVDYLVKPFDFKKFLTAVNRVLDRKKNQQPVRNPVAANHGPLTIKVDGAIINVPLAAISYIQSFGNYVKIFTIDGVLITQMTTLQIINRLSGSHFARIHKSYIVSLKQVKKVTGQAAVLNDGTELPIGTSYKREFVALLT